MKIERGRWLSNSILEPSTIQGHYAVITAVFSTCCFNRSQIIIPDLAKLHKTLQFLHWFSEISLGSHSKFTVTLLIIFFETFMELLFQLFSSRLLFLAELETMLHFCQFRDFFQERSY